MFPFILCLASFPFEESDLCEKKKSEFFSKIVGDVMYMYAEKAVFSDYSTVFLYILCMLETDVICHVPTYRTSLRKRVIDKLVSLSEPCMFG